MDDPVKEILSIVDEDDNVIGSESLFDVHKLGLLHREAHIYVINGRLRVLLQKRADSHLWDTSSAGHFSPEEDYLQGAMREFREELGLALKKKEFRFLGKERLKKPSIKKDSQGKVHHKINNLFAGVFLIEKDIPLDHFSPDPSEVDCVRYFDKKELHDLMKTDDMTAVSKEIIKRIILPLMSGPPKKIRSKRT